MIDGELHQHQIVDILDKDVREVVRLTLSNEKMLVLTPDHEVALADGGWMAAGSLTAGMKVFTNGTPVCRDCGSSERVITDKYSKFIGVCRKCMYAKYRVNGRYTTGKILDCDGYIRLSDYPDHPRQHGGQVYEHIIVMEKLLGRPIGTNEDIHHKNDNRSDNRPENLEIISRAEHHKRHSKYRNMQGGRAGTGGLINFIPSVAEVVSVVPAGREHVYDLVMADPHRNFVANGIIVHNCGKTVEAIATANTIPKAARCLVVCPASLKGNWRKEILAWDAHDPKIAMCDVGMDVPDPEPGIRQWCITNPERLIQTKGRAAVDALAGMQADLKGKRLPKLVAAGEKQRILWIAGMDVQTPELAEGCMCTVGMPDAPAFGTHPGPVVVRVPTLGIALSVANEVNGWTHIVGASVRNLTTRERAGNLWQILMANTWDMVILDEAHRYANMRSASTERVLGVRRGRTRMPKPGLAQNCTRLLALTGTPIPNRVRDIWPLVSTLAPDVFRREGDFLFRYCAPCKNEIYIKGGRGATKSVMTFDGATNLPELQERLRASCMIRRLKADVLAELPPKTRTLIPLSGPEFAKAADAERDAWLRLVPAMSDTVLEATLAEALGDAFAFDQALERLERDMAGVGVSAVQVAGERQALALAKIPLIIEHVRELLANDERRKVVVMAHHRSVLSALASEFGAEAVSLHGGTDMRDRQGIVDTFQTNARVRVFIGGLHAAGVGITLTAADAMVFAEGDWLPWVLAQAEDRIHRIGQLAPVFIYYPVVECSIDALMIAMCIRKQKIIDGALDVVPEGSMKEYPAASPENRAAATQALALWIVPEVLPARVTQLVTGLLERATRRPLTDGEVYLCSKIATQYPKSLPAKLASNLELF